MGNRCYLMGWDAQRGKLLKPQLESTNHVPIFWLAMFDAEDLHDATVDGDAFTVAPNGPSFLQVKTYLSCTGTRALARLAVRTPAIVAAVQHEALAMKFNRFAKAFADRTVLCQLSEIAMMSPPGEYAKTLRESLQLISDSHTPPAKLLTIGGLSEGWETAQYGQNLLVGWGTELSVRERENAKQRKAASHTKRVDLERQGLWQAAIDRCPPTARKAYAMNTMYQVDDVIEHTKFGPGVVLRAIDTKKIEVLFADGAHTLVHRA